MDGRERFSSLPDRRLQRACATRPDDLREARRGDRPPMSRYTLAKLRPLILALLDRGGSDWITASEACRSLGLDYGLSYYRVALTLERLAHEGLAVIRNPRSRGTRAFRRASTDGKRA